MTNTLSDIAQHLTSPKVIQKTVHRNPNDKHQVEEHKPVPKVQLIYAFNGTGKTRLSREIKEIVAPKIEDGGASDDAESRNKYLYYSAFTEDLFYWDNDLRNDAERKLIIQPNSFTGWLLTILKEQGQDGNIVKCFQHYSDDKLTPKFSDDLSEVTFSFQRGDESPSQNIKISKGEESNFIWSIFYSLLEQIIDSRNISEIGERATNEFDDLEYIFIDDPVSSLDDNHLIQLAVDLAALIKSSDFSSRGGLKFIITTHSALFYNVLHNELGMKNGNKKDNCYLLERLDDGTHNLSVKYGDSNKNFSYHLHIKQVIELAIEKNQVDRYHFMLLRNLYEKTASFLGHPEWGDLLNTVRGEKKAYLNRIIQFTSHSSLSSESVADPTPQEKQMVKLLLDNLVDNYSYWKQDA